MNTGDFRAGLMQPAQVALRWRKKKNPMLRSLNDLIAFKSKPGPKKNYRFGGRVVGYTRRYGRTVGAFHKKYGWHSRTFPTQRAAQSGLMFMHVNRGMSRWGDPELRNPPKAKHVSRRRR